MLYFIKHNPRAGVKILMFIMKSLLDKLRDTNVMFILERQSDIQLEDIDPLIQEIMSDI